MHLSMQKMGEDVNYFLLRILQLIIFMPLLLL